MSDQKCVLKQSCCGCSLRSGTLAIGILGLIGGILMAVLGIYAGIKGHTEGWVTMVVYVLHIIICAILIQGVRQEKRGMVMVWVWVEGIIIALNIILAAINIIVSGDFGGAVGLLISGAISVYCVLVARSYAISLSSGSGGGMA